MPIRQLLIPILTGPMQNPVMLFSKMFSGDGKITNDDRILIDKFDVPENFYGITLDAHGKGIYTYGSRSGTR